MAKHSSKNLYEYLGLDADATRAEIVTNLAEKRRENEEASERAKGSVSSLEDLNTEVAIIDIELSIEADQVKRDERDILTDSYRIISLSETLLDLKTRSRKILELLAEEYRRKSLVNSVGYVCCFGIPWDFCNVCGDWTTNSDEQDDWITKIREKVTMYETGYDTGIYDDVSKDQVKEFKRDAAFVSRLQSTNAKQAVSFKHKKSILMIEVACENWKTKKSHYDSMLVKKEALEDNALKQRKCVHEYSEIFHCAEAILLSANLSPMYKEYITHPLYRDTPLITQNALQNMVYLEAAYEENIRDSTTKLNDVIDKHPKSTAIQVKPDYNKSKSKYRMLSTSIVKTVEERQEFVVFSPLYATLNYVLSSMEKAQGMVYVSCNNKGALPATARKQFAVCLSELDYFCSQVYSYKLKV